MFRTGAAADVSKEMRKHEEDSTHNRRSRIALGCNEAPQQTNTPNSNAVECQARHRREIIQGKTDRPTPMIDRLAYLIQKSKDED